MIQPHFLFANLSEINLVFVIFAIHCCCTLRTTGSVGVNILYLSYFYKHKLLVLKVNEN